MFEGPEAQMFETARRACGWDGAGSRESSERQEGSRSQCHSTEISVMIKVFYICVVQYGSYQSCVATEHLKWG